MQIDSARQAATLAAEIDAVNARIATIQAGIAAGNWAINFVQAVDGNGNSVVLISTPLSAADSVTGLQTILGVYQTQLAGLNSQLAAL